MSSGYVVFCTDEGNYHYGWFWHEADVLLTALGQDVAEDKITAVDARRVWEPYRELWTDLYDAQEWEENEFPANEELDYLPGSVRFWHEAAELDIPGVGFSDDISPASGEIFEVHGASPDLLPKN
jgi:virulence-associated protein VagC